MGVNFGRCRRYDVYRVLGVMKQKVLLTTAICLISLYPLKAGAELFEPLSDIYWQTAMPPEAAANMYSKASLSNADEDALCSVPEDFSFLPQITPQIPDDGKPLIAIVIDDMGLDRKRSLRATTLPPQVTLAYIPYSPHVREQTQDAINKGHELIVHVPMQPERGTADPGKDHLSTAISPLELHDRLKRNLDAFEGYVGINNHMGSAFTQNADGMSIVMSELKARELVFLDSKTAPKSVGEKIATINGVPTTHRDIFIDHFEDPVKVANALAQIEKIAKLSGSVVAIGHPKDVTLSALEKWLPTLQAKGFRLAPLTEVIRRRQEHQTHAHEQVADEPAVSKSTPVAAVNEPAKETAAP